MRQMLQYHYPPQLLLDSAVHKASTQARPRLCFDARNLNNAATLQLIVAPHGRPDAHVATSYAAAAAAWHWQCRSESLDCVIFVFVD